MRQYKQREKKIWKLIGAGLALALSICATLPGLAALKAPQKVETANKTAASGQRAKTKTSKATETPPLTTVPEKITVGKEEKELLEHINKERAKVGAEPLTFNATLQKVAFIRGSEVQDSFSHTRPDGSMYHTAFKEVGQEEKYYSAENLSAGREDPLEVCQGWMNSQGHKKNMLNPIYTAAGIKHVSSADNGSKYDDYWVIILQGDGQ